MAGHTISQTILGHSTARLPSAALVRAGVLTLAVALTALAAQFTMPLPGTDVPFVFTPLAVLLIGAALGSRLGATAQVLYVLVGALGVPVFAPDPRLPPGILRLAGPTAGYLMAYPFAAFVTGWLAERGWDRRYWTSLAAMLIGLLVIHAGGTAWRLGWLGSFDLVVATSVAPFLALDVLKAGAAALILPAAWSFLGSHTKSPR